MLETRLCRPAVFTVAGVFYVVPNYVFCFAGMWWLSGRACCGEVCKFMCESGGWLTGRTTAQPGPAWSAASFVGFEYAAHSLRGDRKECLGRARRPPITLISGAPVSRKVRVR